MIKKYKARSLFSITVIPEGGTRTHITFFGLSHGGSFYETDDKAIQDALEASSFFNDYFRLESEREAVTVTEEAVKESEQPAEIRKINVAGLQEAKEFLATQYGIMRTSLRTKTAILAAAKEHNIEFVGI